MKCISIPECTQRLSHLTNSGGQHGQESEEGEEGEVGSEEDCQEDPQGRQEEEVRLRLMELPAHDAGIVTRAARLICSQERV